MTKQYKNRVDRAMNDMDWMDGDDGYQYSESHKKLRRNKIDGMIGGVCAGIGDYIGVDAIIVRVIYILLILFTGFPVFIYFILWVFIPSDNRAPYHREYREARRARRENPENPARTASFRDVKSKFRSLESRMQGLERSITSKEWQLRRDFRDLEE